MSSSDVVAGGYPITVSGASDPNYSINYVNGTMTVIPANQVITWANPAPILFGTPLSGTQLNATVSVVGPASPGALTYTPPAGTVLGLGSGQILSVTAAATNDYNAATAQVMINVLYQFSGFSPPLNNGLTFGAGRTVPIKFQLTDAFGNYITTLSAVTAFYVTYPDGSSHAITGLRYDSTANQYVANWKTKGLVAGSYTIVLSLLDGTTHTITLNITANGNGVSTQVSDGSTSSELVMQTRIHCSLAIFTSTSAIHRGSSQPTNKAAFRMPSTPGIAFSSPTASRLPKLPTPP
jgi:hypothetical protein